MAAFVKPPILLGELFAITLAASLTGCAGGLDRLLKAATGAPVDVTAITSESALRRHVGQRVILRGQFSSLGKLGPYLRHGNLSPCLLSKTSPTAPTGTPPQHPAFREGEPISVAGVLHLYATPPNSCNELDPINACPVDYFYFYWDEITVRRLERARTSSKD